MMNKLYPVVLKETHQVEYIANSKVELVESEYIQYEFSYSGNTQDLTALYPLYFDPLNSVFSTQKPEHLPVSY